MTVDADNAVIDSAAAPSTEGMRAEGDPIEAERVRAEVRFRLFGGTAPTLRVGRFEIGDRLGAGGMGVVYAGRDPDLARPVALKVLFGGGDLRREAQALAKLRHPNVVSVHEIGTWQGLPFVAMELVEGVTLREWVTKSKRSIAEITAVFAGAGRGLAAAHAAGLVHRDFKLDNVLVDREGQARVVDFGLAHPTADGVAIERSTRLDAKGTTVTAAGTPAYMAPEVLAGEPATAQSDQFSFGVALYEALAGKRPYEARDIGGLIAAATKTPPRIPGVPSLVTAMIERSLSPHPADRYPDLGPMIVGLAPRGGGGGSGKWILAVAAVGIAVVVAIIVLTRPAPEQVVDCEHAGSTLGREVATKLPAIKAAFDKVEPRSPTAVFVEGELVEYGERWGAGSVAACKADTPEALKVLRTNCLDDRRRQLFALIAQLSQADAKTIERAPQMISALPAIESCADTSLLAERLPLPQDPAIVTRITAARDRLATARAQFLAGKGPDAKAALDKLGPEIDAIGYAPLTAESQLLFGNITGAANELAIAQPALERAYREGLAGRHDPVAAEAAMRLAHLLGHVKAKPEDGRPWIANAEALLRRIGGTERELDAQLRNVIGNIEQAEGHYDLAIAAFDKAEQAWRDTPGEHHLDLAQTLHNGGNARMLAGKSTAALAKLREAKAMLEKHLPAGHPYIGMTTAALTGALRDLGLYKDALPIDEALVEAAVAKHGKDHVEVAFARGALGNDLRGLARYTEAIAQLEQAGAIFAATFGPDHPTAASTDSNVGAALTGAAQYDEADKRLKKALAGKEKRGPKHPSLISTLDNLGTNELRRGRAAAAKPYFERSLAIGEEALGKESSDVALTVASLGEATLALGDAAGAKVLLERSLALRPKPVAAWELAPTKLALGRALWELGDRARGHALVTEATALLTEASQRYELGEAKRWLATHTP
jgi:eukaryotic-like serine/threonine-protein kinase